MMCGNLVVMFVELVVKFVVVVMFSVVLVQCVSLNVQFVVVFGYVLFVSVFVRFDVDVFVYIKCFVVMVKGVDGIVVMGQMDSIGIIVGNECLVLVCVCIVCVVLIVVGILVLKIKMVMCLICFVGDNVIEEGKCINCCVEIVIVKGN